MTKAFGLEPARVKPPGRSTATHPARPLRYLCGFGHTTPAYNNGKCSECGAACWVVMSTMPRTRRRRKTRSEAKRA